MRTKVTCLHCGTLVKQARLRCRACRKAVSGRIDDRFEQRRRLASDRETIALLAWDRRERQEVFVRAALPSAAASAVRALEVEARLALHNRGQPGFPVLLHAGHNTLTGAAYTVYEHIPGQHLQRALRGLPPVERAELFIQGLRPLALLHAQGVVHSALSLRRFLAAPDGGVVLTGLRHAQPAGVHGGEGGVPGYQAPEQASKTRPVTPATDVFAAGVCLYVLLTGRLPYARRTVRRFPTVCRLPRKPSELNPRLSSTLDALVLRAVDPEPRRRFASAVELIEAFDTTLGTATEVDGLTCGFPHRCVEALNACLHDAAWTLQDIAGFLKRLKQPLAAGFDRYVCVASALTGASRRTVALGSLALATLIPALILVNSVTGSPRASHAPQARPGDVSAPAQPQGTPATANEPQEARVQFHSWPPAQVYLDGRHICEAPSPEWFVVQPGAYRLVFVPGSGKARAYTMHVTQGGNYVVKANLGTGFYEIEKETK